MSSKICSQCGIEKDLGDFHKKTSSKDGVRSQCKEWEELKKVYNYCCIHCNKNESDVGLLHRDHIIPISRLDLGPTNYISNIQPLCQSCNSKKGNKII